MDILGSVTSALGGDGKGNILGAILELVQNQSGGINGLIAKFKANGLGDVIESWLGNGENKSISTGQVQNIFGSDAIKNIASKFGLNTDSLASQISELLPTVIDKLSPGGKMPEGDLLSKGADLLGGMFGNK